MLMSNGHKVTNCSFLFNYNNIQGKRLQQIIKNICKLRAKHFHPLLEEEVKSYILGS
jgi:hypothetical protein